MYPYDSNLIHGYDQPATGLSLLLGSKQIRTLSLQVPALPPHNLQFCLSPGYSGYNLGNAPLSHFLLPSEVSKNLLNDKSALQE